MLIFIYVKGRQGFFFIGCTSRGSGVYEDVRCVNVNVLLFPVHVPRFDFNSRCVFFFGNRLLSACL